MTRPTVVVADEGAARYEVLQTVVATSTAKLAENIARGYVAMDLVDRAQEWDAMHLLATHEVQRGVWEVSWLVFWRTEEVPS